MNITTTFPFLLAAVAFCPSAHSQTVRPGLTLQTAQAIASACHALAREQGWRMAVAVNDETGRLMHFSRTEGAVPISVAVAQLKADTSSLMPISTRSFRAAARHNQGAERLQNITTVAGGLPVLDGRGQAVGSVGVSGGDEDQDETCALAALSAVKEMLP